MTEYNYEIVNLRDYKNYKDIKKGPITEAELEQMIKDGYPISGGGPIPSDYQTHLNDGRTK